MKLRDHAYRENLRNLIGRRQAELFFPAFTPILEQNQAGIFICIFYEDFMVGLLKTVKESVFGAKDQLNNKNFIQNEDLTKV